MSVAEQAKRVYESRLKTELEAKHRDRFVAIEPVSESFFLGDEFITGAEPTNPDDRWARARAWSHAVRCGLRPGRSRPPRC